MRGSACVGRLEQAEYRKDKSFADDLNMGPGIVSGRVALLLRSAEIKPVTFDLPFFPPHSTITITHSQLSDSQSTTLSFFGGVVEHTSTATTTLVVVVEGCLAAPPILR